MRFSRFCPHIVYKGTEAKREREREREILQHWGRCLFQTSLSTMIAFKSPETCQQMLLCQSAFFSQLLLFALLAFIYFFNVLFHDACSKHMSCLSGRGVGHSLHVTVQSLHVTVPEKKLRATKGFSGSFHLWNGFVQDRELCGHRVRSDCRLPPRCKQGRASTAGTVFGFSVWCFKSFFYISFKSKCFSIYMPGRDISAYTALLLIMHTGLVPVERGSGLNATTS